MSEEQSAYRQIVKATSLFGGVQAFNIIISIIRSKFIAVLLGPAGMGISGLLTSTIEIISGLTNFGLGISAVKDVAAANATGDQTRVAIVVTVFRRWVWITGTLGAIVMLVLSPWLSTIIFGNSNYTIAFVCISITLLFSQISVGQLVVLQGMRKLKYLAKADIIGSILGLFITIPLYYRYGINGIVPGIIFTAILFLLISWYFGHKIKIEAIKVSWATTLAEGKSMLTMGFVIAMNGFILMGASYIVRIYISKTGGLEDVGLYSSGFFIINSYVGMVFAAMVTDYYPRLSAVAHDNKLCKQNINQQANVTLLILGPIIIVFLVFIKIVVLILLSNRFLAITNMINWAMLGVFFKAASWPIGFIFIPKGDSKLFFWSELIANIYMLVLNILGYYIYGLTGLGIAFLAGYIIYLIQVFILSKIKYEFAFDSAFIRIFVFQFLLAVGCFCVVKILGRPYSYIAGVALIIISSLYSYKELDKRLGLKTILAGVKDRFIKK